MSECSFVLLTILAALGVLAAEKFGSQKAKWIAKPVAAVGFLGAASLGHGAPSNAMSTWLLVALVLSAVGDVALVPKGTGWPFRIGMLAFMLAHVAFIAGFRARAAYGPEALLNVIIVLGVCLGLGSPLVRRAPTRLKIPVALYALAVSSMAAFAVTSGSRVLALAGAAFLASDVFVALHRFTTPRFAWKVCAIPLYYGAQLAFASVVR